jgi:hypothetical protein
MPLQPFPHPNQIIREGAIFLDIALLIALSVMKDRKLPLKEDMLKVELSGKIPLPGGVYARITIY